MKRNTRKAVCVFAIVAALAGLSANSNASKAVIANEMAQAILSDDFETFDQILNSGEIGIDDFSSDPKLYKLICGSTHEEFFIYLDRLLEFGVDPSTESPERTVTSSYPLMCAYIRENLAAFTKLLDAGARSDVSVCRNCVRPIPLVKRVLGEPEMFLEIVSLNET